MPYTPLDPTTATVVTTTIGNPLTSTGETLSSMQNELTNLIGGSTYVDPPRLAKYINFAYRDMCSSLALEELIASVAFSTVAAQPLYLLPSSMRSTRGVSISDTVTYPVDGGVPLRKRDVQWYRMQPVYTDVGPTDYFKYNNLIVLWPTPSQIKVLTAEFRIRPVDLAQPTDSPILPVDWHEGIILLARQKLFSAVMDFDLAAIAQNDYIAFVRRRMDLAAEEQENLIAGVRPVFANSSFTRNQFAIRNPDLD